MTYKALFLSPMIPSTNLLETLWFFRDILDFSTVMENEGYIVCHKDNLTIHILRAGQELAAMAKTDTSTTFRRFERKKRSFL